MKPKLLLRIAAVLMFLHTMGHTLGALTWKIAPNPAVGLVIKGMETNHFDFMGRSATLASFYDGFGFTMILVLLFISILLWLLSAETGTSLSARLVPMLAVFLLLMGVIEYIYFFPFAAAFTFIAGLCTVVSLFIKSTSGPILNN
jgi:fucose 4-O-acetylase-like acetyltransferase